MKDKRLSPKGKAAIVLIILAFVFLALSIASASISVGRTTDAIDAIGEVIYEPATRERIDAAESAWQALDTNLGLQYKVANREVLVQAKAEYVRLAIKELYLAEQEDGAELDTSLIAAAREAFDAYFTEADAALVSNYSDLLDAEARYATGTADTTAPVEEEAEEIELC